MPSNLGTSNPPAQIQCTRRAILQAGALGVLGLDAARVQALQAASDPQSQPLGSAKSVLFIFLSGGLSQGSSKSLVAIL